MNNCKLSERIEIARAIIGDRISIRAGGYIDTGTKDLHDLSMNLAKRDYEEIEKIIKEQAHLLNDELDKLGLNKR